MKGPKIKISIIDDHPIVVEGFASLFHQHNEIELVSVYTQVKDLLRDFKSSTPDVLILDIKMPEMSGEEIVEYLKKNNPNVKILVLTYLDSIYYARSMLRRGVLGYLLKTSPPAEIFKAIKEVNQGEQYIEESLKTKIVQQALLNKKQVSNMPALTRRELEILQLMASNYNSFEIAQKLFLSKRTVENHRANMLMKLKVKNAPALIKKAVEFNLL